MKKSIEIVKTLLIPKLEKDIYFHRLTLKDAFWEYFTLSFLNYENDAKPAYKLIYALQLENPEIIFDKLPYIYSKLVKELAESYVLGEPSEAKDYLLKTNNITFAKEIDFLKTMQQAIKSVERKRIKAELPTSYERLSFELSETDLANATKKKGREDLKEKMKQWDEELKSKREPTIFYSLGNETKSVQKSKVISLSWIKYAAAACIIITAGTLYFKFAQTDVNRFSQPTENTVVATDAKKDSTQPQKNTPVKEGIVLAEIETVSEKVIVQQSESIGFSSTEKPKITISYKDARQRIISLEKYIATLSSTKEPATLAKYKSELYYLKKSNDNYIFDGKILTLFSKFNPKQDAVLVTDDQNYFLKKGNVYYNLKITKVSIPLEKVTNATTLELVEKITFENE
jgi:hypothetical protein